MAAANVKHWEVIVYHETKLNREMFRAVVSAPDRYSARDTVLRLSPSTLSVMQTSTSLWCPVLSLSLSFSPPFICLVSLLLILGCLMRFRAFAAFLRSAIQSSFCVSVLVLHFLFFVAFLFLFFALGSFHV